MNGSTIARLAATAAAVGIGTATVLGATGAQAAPAKSPVDTAIGNLTHAAGKDQRAQAGVQALGKTAQLVSAAHLDDIAGGFQSFAYLAPTVGCGDVGVTMTAGSGTSGISDPSHGINGPGWLKFAATPSVSGFPVGSGLNVAWLNTSNGQSGIISLDDRTDYQTPALSKTVRTGPGNVVASLWGTVNYPGSMCVVTPTVGLFTVPAPPPPPAAPGGPPAPAAPGAPAPKAPAPAAPPAPAPHR